MPDPQRGPDDDHDDRGATNLAPPPTSSTALTDLTLAVRIEGLPEQEVFLQHGLSIGRNPSNTISISDSPEVERIHAMVAKQGDGTMLLECTDAHLRLTLPDGSQVHSLTLKPGATFRLGKATIRCLKRETKPTVVVADNPWEVRCPRCFGVIADLPHAEHACPHCTIELQYFVSHHSAHGPDTPQSSVHEETPLAPEFSGWLPRHVGPYKIRAFVAQGGMGIILRGLHTEADLPAAVKLLKSDPEDDPSWRARFMAEIDTLKTLRHPNVVHLQDSGKDDQLLWLAMDWIEGQPLTKLMATYRAQGKPFPIDELRTVLSQVVTGLKYLHEKHLVHRDLKPSNVLMATDSLVKLVDFGIAKSAGGQSRIVTQLTQTGMVAGTESYMSPEQAEGQSVGPASDVYSLGVMWYELITGRRPVGAFAAPHIARPDCPISWSHTIAGCLATEPRVRPSLDRILAVLTTNAAEPPPLPAQRTRGPAGSPPRTPPGGVPARPPSSGNVPARPPSEVAQMATQVRPAHRPPASPPDRAAASQMATQVNPARPHAAQPNPPSKPRTPALPPPPPPGAPHTYAPNPYAQYGPPGGGGASAYKWPLIIGGAALLLIVIIIAIAAS
ncbi:MAG: protein kinase [Phycisphaerae bacterium]